MKIYDLHTYELSGQISEIDYAPMAMDVWQPQRCKDAEMIVFGDGGGYVRLYEVRMNPAEDKNSADRYLDTLKWKFRHHTDWVTTVKYVDEMNAVISGSLDRNICVTDAEERVPLKVLEGHIKGVNTVDWSSSYKYIASGGQDRRIMLWNPFSKKSLATLTGHTSSVMSIVVNDNDFQIISLGADKQVKLWDVRNHKCIQTISDRQVYPADDTLMCMCYDFKRKRLLTGNQKPKLWQQSVSSVNNAAGPPVVRIIYNPNFNEAVTGDQGGAISVWHVPTGKLRYRFTNTHKGKQLTAINFDSAKRRLLTGAEDGEVKVWNFSSGACLCTLQPKTREEVTAILAIRGSFMKHFLVAGWDRRVTFYEDDGQKEAQPGRIISGHKADILDMDVMENSPTLVTVSDDGEACLWNIDSGALRRRIVPEGHELLPANEQPIEAVRFLKEPLQRFFVTVGADRFLRIWDQSGSCMAEVGTGHKLDETVAALTVDATNSYIATGDSAGQFVLSSSLDRSTALWTSQGALLGHFGAHLWFWDMPHSWASQTPPVMEMKEEYEMQVSAAASRQEARQRAQARTQLRKPSMHSHQQLHWRQSEETPLHNLYNTRDGQQGVGARSSVRDADQDIVSRLLSKTSRRSFASPEGLSPKHSMPGSVQQGVQAPDGDRELSLYGESSESSSNHASDEDIPRALWLPDFELVRKHAAWTPGRPPAPAMDRLGTICGMGMLPSGVMGLLVPICLSIRSRGTSRFPESPTGMPLLAGMLSSCVAGREGARLLGPLRRARSTTV
ncbi:WD40-repeat-containing domain protein [Dunaliella salina]|uniref:WD40-repeat-containing domain protein n=1 Tax=Dunaliella salina TaxID=3046 RepID=A0ABQ7GBJ0_DUNSA|nr:WD40-repeat-containing domain protein [Dunaliella salina]|eukprot:KAF5831982.1 WD40-repeat-containing domain protein [Dunaliella salina]